VVDAADSRPLLLVPPAGHCKFFSVLMCAVPERTHAAGAADQRSLLLVTSAERSITQCFEVTVEQRNLDAAGRWPLLLVLACWTLCKCCPELYFDY